MRVLLTGSSGWLGGVLGPALRTAGHVTIGLDVAPGPQTEVVGTIADRRLVDRVFAEKDVEAVIHAGALHKPDIARSAAQAFIDTNVTGTLNLLEAAVAARHDRFVFTSTTSLMISQSIRDETATAAVWLDEQSGPLAPRNVYGVTKLAAEGLCRLHHIEHGLNCVILRTARFFPEGDDKDFRLEGPNLKANELLHRRLTVADAARAHVAALDRAPDIGFDLFVVSAPTPFVRADLEMLKIDARSVVSKAFPDAAELYGRQGWELPRSISRVYDAARAQRVLGFRCETDFETVLDALRRGRPTPFSDDAEHVPPRHRATRDVC